MGRIHLHRTQVSLTRDRRSRHAIRNEQTDTVEDTDGGVIHEALCLIAIALVLLILAYLVASFVVSVIPAPFGSLEDFPMWSLNG